jgi:uncharacterized protein (TIGR03435 family)
MLRTLLADRFKLVVHHDVKPVQAFVLSLEKGNPKLKEADGSATPDATANLVLLSLEVPRTSTFPAAT